MDTNEETLNSIIFQERYGSSSNRRYYVKPPDQTCITAIDENSYYNLIDWFKRVLLPQGYPDSVSEDYAPYQIWDTAQAFCSTVAGILATQQVLRGVGVGDSSITPLAATITWVVKDGCGHLGRILFAYSHGTLLDAYSKKWRLCADILNDVSMCIEMFLPFTNYTRSALCVSSAMRAVVGVAGGATRMAMTQHHAVRGNMADVAAKDSAQETAVNLVASIATLMFISMFGDSKLLFALMVAMHIVFNYLAVRSVCLRVLNEPRFLHVIEAYLKLNVIETPDTVNKNENFIFYGENSLDFTTCGFRIVLGHSLEELVKTYKKASYFAKLKSIYENRNYLFCPDFKRKVMFVLVKEGATTEDILCSYLHAVMFGIIVCFLIDIPLEILQPQDNESIQPLEQVCRSLRVLHWWHGSKHTPALIKFVDGYVQLTWRKLKHGMRLAGWDLSKHLLVVDEWRVIDSDPHTDQ